MGARGLRGVVFVKIKIVKTPLTRVPVHIDQPEWREYLYY